MLLSLKQDILKYLTEVFDVKGGDSTKIFLHFPYVEKTTTLHFHITINKKIHPMSLERAFDLDDIINHLRVYPDLSKMVMGKKYFHAPV